MQGLNHLTNTELVSQLTLRDDLTDLELQLLDRLIRANDEVARLETDINHLHEEIERDETPPTKPQGSAVGLSIVSDVIPAG